MSNQSDPYSNADESVAESDGSDLSYIPLYHPLTGIRHSRMDIIMDTSDDAGSSDPKSGADLHVPDQCSNCRFWRPYDPVNREPYPDDTGAWMWDDVSAPCGVRPPTEWIRDPAYLAVEPPYTGPERWCRFHDPVNNTIQNCSDLYDYAGEPCLNGTKADKTHTCGAESTTNGTKPHKTCASGSTPGEGTCMSTSTLVEQVAEAIVADRELHDTPWDDAMAAIHKVADWLDALANGCPVEVDQAIRYAADQLRSQLEKK